MAARQASEVDAPALPDRQAQPHAPLPQPNQMGHTPPPHGVKRTAENGLESEQRLSKRFDLLNLGMRHLTQLCSPESHRLNSPVVDNGKRLYIPVPGSTDTTSPAPKPIP